MEIELAGVGLGQFDRIEHILGSGIADLGGTLDVSLLGGFTPDVGDTFEIITAADVQDMFAIENFPVVAGLDWNVVYGATNVVLEVVSAVDLDGDDDIDGRDFLLVQANTPALIPIWEEQYGTSIATLPAAQTAPEPSSWICLLTTAAFIRGRRVFYACDRRVLLGV